MNHNAVALGCLILGCGLAVFLPQWVPTLEPKYLSTPFVKFLLTSFGFIFGVYFVSTVVWFFAKRDSFSPSRVTLMALLGAFCGLVANSLVFPYLPEQLRNPASGDVPIFETTTNFAISGFALILPVVVGFLYIRIALAIHGKLSKLMRWTCVGCFAALLVSGYWFFGSSSPVPVAPAAPATAAVPPSP